MTYYDVIMAAVPTANRDAYAAHAAQSAQLFKQHGALRSTECWGVNVPSGQRTSMLAAVECQPDETVVTAWVAWPSKAARDAAWEKIKADGQLRPQDFPFDGARMIYGGFEAVAEA